ncbi:sulfotransferase family protein [Lacinutrix gracilariae]|uniref:Sulfotransferase family protein n=1 Tax=Lacinutrix gracilariae TaxID=1747198 RepID=A0ABW5K382_9FLAO
MSSRINFIVGMPRAGTTYLTKVLNNHPNIVCSGETLYYGRKFVTPNDSGNYSEKEVGMIFNNLINQSWDPKIINDAKPKIKKELDIYHANISKEVTVNTPLDVFGKVLCDIHNKEQFIEKTPHHIQYINRIKKYNPEAKFIALVRNPYTFMLSYKFQGQQKNEVVRSIFEKIYHPISCALVWRKNYNAISTAKNNFPKDVLVIETEALKSNQTLADIQSFFYIKSPDLKPITKDNSSFKNEVSKPVLEPIDYFWMNIIAGQQITAHLGQKTKSNASLSAIVKSLIQLPIVFFRFLNVLEVGKGQSKFQYLLGYLKR